MEKYLDNQYGALLSQIRARMKEHGLTQADVGKALGLTQGSVSALLNGDSQMSVTQLLSLSSALGTKGHRLLSDAESSLIQSQAMTPAMEAAIYKSETRLLAYTAATIPVSVKDIAVGGITEQAARAALDDLVAVDLLKKEKEKYVQKDPSRSFVAQNRAKSSDCHRKVVSHSWRMWTERLKSDSYRKKRFNFYLLERFSTVQIKEIETMLWAVYEKIDHFQKENMARKYLSSDDDMTLWNVHCMLMTPLEER